MVSKIREDRRRRQAEHISEETPEEAIPESVELGEQVEDEDGGDADNEVDSEQSTAEE